MAQPHPQKTILPWRPVGVPAPFNADLELAVLDREGTRALVFPCRRRNNKEAARRTAYALEKMAGLMRFLFAIFFLSGG
jgi:hypothetical protein